MKKNISIIVIGICISIFLILVNNSVSAATFSISSSTTTVEPGESFTVTIRTNGAGYVNLSCTNGTISEDYVWVEGSKSVTCTAGSTDGAVVTVSATGKIGDFDSGNDENKSRSTSVTIKKKEQPKTETKPAETKTTTTTTKTTTTKTDTEKKEEKKTEDDFYITSLNIKAVKENGEEVDVVLSPEFKKNVYSYTAVISSDITKLSINKEAGAYTNSIIVNGDEELKVGENVITLHLNAEDHEEKIYTIKITKQEQEESIEDKEEIIEAIRETINMDDKKEPYMLVIPAWKFIVIQIGVGILEIIGILIAFRIKKKNSSNERLDKWK